MKKGWDPHKPAKQDANDTTIHSHHPYILCHFANYALCLLIVCIGELWKAVGREVVGALANYTYSVVHEPTFSFAAGMEIHTPHISPHYVLLLYHRPAVFTAKHRTAKTMHWIICLSTLPQFWIPDLIVVENTRLDQPQW